MKTRKKVAVLTITVLLLSGASVFAQQGRGYSQQGQNQDQTCQRIPDLTEDQETKIKAFKAEHLKEMTALRNQMNELRAKKQTLMTTDNADMKEINSLIDQMTELQNKKMKASAQHHHDVRNQLTDEQKVFFDNRPMKGHRNGMKSGNRGGRGNAKGVGQGRNS